MELIEYVLHMLVDGRLSEAEFLRYLAATHAVTNKVEDLTLTWGEYSPSPRLEGWNVRLQREPQLTYYTKREGARHAKFTSSSGRSAWRQAWWKARHE